MCHQTYKLSLRTPTSYSKGFEGQRKWNTFKKWQVRPDDTSETILTKILQSWSKLARKTKSLFSSLLVTNNRMNHFFSWIIRTNSLKSTYLWSLFKRYNTLLAYVLVDSGKYPIMKIQTHVKHVCADIHTISCLANLLRK